MKTLFLAAAAALMVAAPASAAPQTFYFDCGGQTPVTNLTPAPLTWSATPPATAFSDGGGCVSADYQSFTTSFGGTYAGEVKQIDLAVYGALSNPAYRQLLGPSLDVTVAVDGKTVFEGTQLAGGNEAGGPLPGGFKWTQTIPELDIPATATPKKFEITVSNPFADDAYVLGYGASDLPSAITFSAQADLPAPEEDPGF